jgi:cytochrome P450
MRQPAITTPAPVDGARLDLDRIPGPEPLPLVGWRGNVARFFLDPIAYLDRLAHGGYGDLVMFARGMRGGALRPGRQSPASVLGLGPAFNQPVLAQHGSFHPLLMETPPGARGLKRLYSGILWMSGDQHKQQRRLIAPAFHPKRIEGYHQLLVSSTEAVLSRWRPGDDIDPLDEARRILLGFLNRILIGDDDMPGAVSIGERMEDVARRALSPAALVPLDLPLSPRRRMIAEADRLYADLEAIIAKKRARPENADDLLSTLIHARDEDGTAMSEDELVGQLYLLFFAGFESSMSALGWTSYLLAQHPQVAAALHDELTGTLRGGAPTLAQLGQLPLLDAVIKESLRLFPPVYILTRTLAEPMELGGYQLPERTEIFLSLYHTHRRPELYDEPLRFRPERWAKITPGSWGYLPFGAGAHTCLGWGLAVMELKIMLALMVQRFRLALPASVRIDRRTLAVMSPKPGVRMRVHRQDRRFTESRATVQGHFPTMVELERQ